MHELRESAMPWQGSTLGVEVPPVAPVLMNSLRAVGYDAPAALADLVDNSIAAKATRVSILFRSMPEPLVAIIDNGDGMDDAELVAAMRFGSKDPEDHRSGNDLGRFGLGLKTASLSQCRRLTVATIKAGHLAVATWDLDECRRRGTWWLERGNEESLDPQIRQLLHASGAGTAVIWEKLDRLTVSAGDRHGGLDAVMDEAADRLALAFHRFLAGEIAGAFTIDMNGRALPVFDPFLEKHARGQTLHGESINLQGHTVRISPFVLPFPSRLKPDELERAGGRDRLKTGHGFYIYRGGRLVVPGGWFRIVPADELVRLARIRVDVPIELDHIWKIDIRKTMVEPPGALRPHLKRIVGAVQARSRNVYRHRGTKVDEKVVPIWSRHELRDHAAAWRVNRDHPLIKACLRSPSEAALADLLSLIETSIPVQDIYIQMTNDLPVAPLPELEEAELEHRARRLVAAFADQPEELTKILKNLHFTYPFDANPDTARRIAERLLQ
jgi:hypothetical protein